MKFYECFECRKVQSVLNENLDKCPSCESYNGRFISNETAMDRLESGVYFDLINKKKK